MVRMPEEWIVRVQGNKLDREYILANADVVHVRDLVERVFAEG